MFIEACTLCINSRNGFSMEHCLGSNVQTLANYTIKPMLHTQFLYIYMFFFFLLEWSLQRRFALAPPDLMAKNTHAAVR